jgi:putative two-component system response regulator
MVGTVLIVDDDVANRELLQELLSGAGFRVETAVDGAHSLQEFLRVRPDLVLLDVQMPLIDGFEVCRRIKSAPDTRLTPVVLVTALSATQDRVRGLQVGADDFLSKPVDRTELLARTHSLVSLKKFTDELERAESVLFALANSIEGKDPYTVGHCERLSSLSTMLGIRLGVSAEDIQALRRAGIVHDIGKVAVPDSILCKPSRLTSAEFEVVKEHPVVGERICAPLKSFAPVLPIIRHHHEKQDGTGYPDRLIGDQIPFTARVLQIVDVYDALTTERPYKKALSTDAALETMQDEVLKGWWDKNVFASFCTLIQSAHLENEIAVNGPHRSAAAGTR